MSASHDALAQEIVDLRAKITRLKSEETEAAVERELAGHLLPSQVRTVLQTLWRLTGLEGGA